jgi:hypothetical protein
MGQKCDVRLEDEEGVMNLAELTTHSLVTIKVKVNINMGLPIREM